MVHSTTTYSNLPLTTPNFVAIDTETTGLNPWAGDRMFATAAIFASGRTLYWRSDFGGLREVLEDPTVDKVFHNAKFDVRMLEFAGYTVRGRIWDTAILAHLMSGTRSPSLDFATKRFLPPSNQKVVEEINDWFKEHKILKDDWGNHYADLPPEMCKRRCVGDITLTAKLFMKLYPACRRFFPLLLEQEHRLLWVSKRMEDRGLLIDQEEIVKQRAEMGVIVDEVYDFCYNILGHERFSLTSPNDQAELLDHAGILDQITERTPKTRKHKLNEQNLRNLHHPVSHMLLLGKKAQDLDSKFLKSLQRLAVDDVVHASFNQLGTVTGRFSCSKPNLENQPTEGGHMTSEEYEEAVEMTGYDLAPHIKKCFSCRPGYSHLHSDKNKVEVLMLAHYSKDKVLLEAMTSGHDIHEEMSMRMFGEKTKGLRVRAKVTVFGFMYGVGDAGLAKILQSTQAEAKQYKDRLRALCPSIDKFKRLLSQQIQDRGYLETDHGRRHYLNTGESYMAVNRMCQGTAADEVKARMLAIDDMFQIEQPESTILLNIHDDVGSEVPTELLPEIAPVYHKLMEESSIPFALPLPASLEATHTTWADLTDYPGDD